MPALLVLGATGAIGRGVVRAALDAGRPVIAVSPDADGLRDLQGSRAHADFVSIALPLDARNAPALVDELRKLDRPVDGVIAALCNERERGRLLDAPATEMRDALDASVIAHLAFARELLPLLAEGGRAGGYVLIDGPGGENPWAGYGHRSVGGAALRMLARVLHDEARPMGVRVQLLALEFPVRTDANAKHACDLWPHADGIGRRVVAMLERKDRVAPEPIVHCRGPCSDEKRASGSQTSDGEDPSLSARCFDDARKLLGALTKKQTPAPSPNPSPIQSKEDAP
ncbi:SDR family oxidoreductase [Lysobacter sp. A6]|uniref:SDR family oxidoreductase n=1 Tax=Noviluteimonas lactosilytica TaxID=2888523 RepID=A0ABS8JE31_9GAMM|nr:SDR family oxidoreductase [Lysobacter lactosilyticus]MCC8361795.1 SDR family oxidoreductase [Lysobacter lactosilyticus]